MQGTKSSDLLARLGLAAWFVFLEYTAIMGLAAYAAGSGEVPRALFIANLLARSASVLFSAVVIVMAIIRMPPIQKTAGVPARLVAFMGSFLMVTLLLFPARAVSPAVGILSAILICLGNTLSAMALLRLGRSFSIMAEARKLVTNGPFSLIRHPLYVAEELAIVGAFLQYASPWTALLLIAHGAMQLCRMKYEERVLDRTFPEYAAYARRTARVIPYVY